MPGRLSFTSMWESDWFLALDGKCQHLANYIRDHCDCAGVWRPAFRMFEKISGFRVSPEEFLSTVNNGKVRVLVLDSGKWWITGFLEDQLRTTELDERVGPHKGALNSLDFHKIPYKSYGYKIRVKEGMCSLPGGSGRTKEKDIEKDIEKDKVQGVDRGCGGKVWDWGDPKQSEEVLKPKRKRKDLGFSPPDFETFKKYCADHSFEHIARRAYEGYAEAGWHDSQGKPIRSWKQKLQHVWFRDDNKKPVERDGIDAFREKHVKNGDSNANR